MATIKDVARLSGVSIATASRVINQSGYASKESVERVKNAMELLNYNPNQLARGLVSKKTSTIGLVVPDVSNPFFAEIAKGTEDAAVEKGYSLILCNTDWRMEREQMYFNLLKGKWVEGVIVVGSRTQEDFLLKELKPLPYVIVDRKLKDGKCVWVDHEKGGKMATNYLVEKGCRDIFYIGGPSNSFSAVSRKRGFEAAICESRSIKARAFEGDFRFKGGYDIAKDLFLKGQTPDGIFAANDLMAIGVLQAAKECGIDIPRDLLLVGYDDIDAAKYVFPPLTTVRQPSYEMGREAFSLLYDSLNEESSEVNHKEFDVEMIQRDSTI